MLFQHVGIVWQLLYICRDALPVCPVDIILHLLSKGVLIPCRAVFRILKQSLVFQIPAAQLVVGVQVCRQVGLDTAFGRVDLKSRQNRKRFGFLSALFFDVGIRIFIVSENTAVKSGIGNLPDTRGKGVFDCLKPSVQVICIPQLRIGSRNTEQGQIVPVRKSVFKWIRRFLIVRGDTFTYDRLKDDFDHIPVIVRTAEPFGNERPRFYHYNTRQV